MEATEIKSIIESAFDDAVVEVVVEGSHVGLNIVSEAFAGLNTLKRQQKVYGILSEHIASGAIHAVHMKTLTPAEQ